jgi:hypothetical protein
MVMKVQGKCTICGKALQIDCDKDCDWEWRVKLTPLLTCHRCYDYRFKRQQIMGRLRMISIWLDRRTLSEEQKGKVREKATDLLDQFMRVISDYRQIEMPDSHRTIIEDAAQDFMDSPTALLTILRHLSGMIKQQTQMTYDPSTRD